MHWLTETIREYRNCMTEIEFYQSVKASTNKSDFAWVRYLFHISYEFPRLLSLRYSLCKKPEYRRYFAVHAEEEYGHCEMLRDWMIRHGLLSVDEDINAFPPTIETTSAISYFYRLVLTEEELAQLVGINAVLEGFAADFYSIIAPIIHEYGMGDKYWDLHAFVDNKHSQDCFTMLPEIERDSVLGKRLERILHESFLLYAYMLNSWIGKQEALDLDVWRKRNITSPLNTQTLQPDQRP